MANPYGSAIDAGPGLPAPAVSGDQSDFDGVPGVETPMHPGFNANKTAFRKTVSSKHKSFSREQAPMYKGGRGGNDGTR
jgi:hypothetical protein